MKNAIKLFSSLIVMCMISTVLFAQDAVQTAKAKFAAGDSSTAIVTLEKEIAQNPGNTAAKRTLADISTETGEREYIARNFKNAFEFFKKAVKVMPTHPIATERYWKMKQDFDVTNLRNEGGALPKPTPDIAVAAVETPSPGKTAARDVKNGRAVKGKQAETVINTEDAYARRILQMEERFNKRMMDIVTAQNKNFDAKKTAASLAELGTVKIVLLSSGAVVVLGLLVFGFIRIKRFVVKVLKARRGKREYESLFSAETFSSAYNELIKMQNINELLAKLKAGELDWSVIKKRIGEMDRELRLEVLHLIEGKLDRERMPLSQAQADVIMSLVLDGDDYLRKRVHLLLKGQMNTGFGFTGQNALSYNPQDNRSAAANTLLLADQRQANLSDVSVMEDLNIVIPLSKIVDRKVFKDNHSLRVGVDAYLLAGILGFDTFECNLYYLAGLIHDVGYLDIPSELLNKKSSLSEKEFDQIKTHPKRGIDLLDFTVLPETVKHGILYHHEKWTGGGYPEGLEGENIPFIARVIALFDVYEALVLPRPQRPPFTVREAIKTIKKGAGTLFDPDLIAPFEKMAQEGMLSKEEPGKK